MALAYLNGRFVPDADLRLSFADAGFVSGATVTDFCRTYRRTLFRWPDHLARLRRDAETCHIPLLHTDAELTDAAERLIEAHEGSDDLAVVTFATPGPLAYMTGVTADGPPTLGMHCFPIPTERYRRFFTDGVELQTVGENPTFLPGVKHRSRLAWWLAGKRVDKGLVAVLAGDTAIGAVLRVAEGTVFAAMKGTALDSISATVVEELCGSVGLKFARVAFPKQPDEVMLAGSAFGLAGVRRFDGRQLPCPGPVTAKLQAAWSRLVGLDITAEFRLSLFSPKGWEYTAQGNALGTCGIPHFIFQPERLGLSQPFRLQCLVPRDPGRCPGLYTPSPSG